MKRYKSERIWISLFIVICFGGMLAMGSVPRQQLTQPAVTLPCAKELAAIKESMFQSSMGEALLAKRLGDEDAFNSYLRRAHTVRNTDELRPSPAVCETGNIKTLRIMAAGWEYDYLLDSAALVKWENQ